ncbi:hypothetical protein [Halorussus sp. AFM4]|uniref:hypothetical protein n=1 Tax=Halorussus sp. AFM4 TaxID=3421651 RepID=UPI003EBBFAA5
MAATLSFGGQVSLLNDHVDALNDWLADEGIDAEFGRVYVIGETTESGVRELLSGHLEKLERFERRILRNHDVRKDALRERTNPVRFDLKRIGSLFLST